MNQAVEGALARCCYAALFERICDVDEKQSQFENRDRARFAGCTCGCDSPSAVGGILRG